MRRRTTIRGRRWRRSNQIYSFKFGRGVEETTKRGEKEKEFYFKTNNDGL